MRVILAMALLGGAVALWAVLGVTLGPWPSIRLLGVLAIAGILPGAALARLILPVSGAMVLVPLGAVIGLGLWSLGGVLSDLSGYAATEWLPVILAYLLWVFPPQGGPFRRANWLTDPKSKLPLAGVAAAAVGVVALIPGLRTALASAPVRWTGWHRFYTDLPFHSAIAADVAQRTPQEASWLIDTPLSYTWFFHAAAGFWSSAAGVPAVDVVLQAWPVLYVILVPLLIAVVAWQLSKSAAVAAIAPLLFALGRGPTSAPHEFELFPLFQISPTRDFSNLFVLLAVLALAHLLAPVGEPGPRRWWLVTLALAIFVATGSKGSAMPVLAGGLAAAFLTLIVTRKLSRSILPVLVVFILTAVSAYVIAIPNPAIADGLKVAPLTFLSADTPDRFAVSAALVVVLGSWILGSWIAVARSGDPLKASLFAGVAASGLGGMAILGHPGFSEVYFWQNAQPILVILVAWSWVVLYKSWRWRFAISCGLVLVVGVVAARLGLNGLAAGIVILATSAAATALAIFLPGPAQIRRPKGTNTGAVVISLMALFGGIASAGQLFSVTEGVSGGHDSDQSDAGAISDDQLAAYRYIRDNSSAYDAVATNKHCIDGTIAQGDCDYRWFALAAFSERRVLVDGWGYTQYGPAQARVQDRLDLSDGFILHPTSNGLDALKARGVRYIYVDVREPHVNEFGHLASLVFSSRWARVYSLN